MCARKTAIHCMGANQSLHYRLTEEWILSGTVVFASIASSQDILLSNAYPSRDARNVEDHIIPSSTRIQLQNPQGPGNPRSLHKCKKTLRL